MVCRWRARNTTKRVRNSLKLSRSYYVYALYVCLICMPAMCLVCMPDVCVPLYMYALCVCLICMPAVCLVCMPDETRQKLTEIVKVL